MLVSNGVWQNNILMKFVVDDVIINDAYHIEETTLGAAIKSNCSIELISLLLQKGAEIKTEYKLTIFPLPVAIHEYNHLHLAILCKRVDVVELLLKNNAQIITSIPFMQIFETFGQLHRLHGISSLIKDNKGNIIYAETELCSHGLLTTINIAFGAGNLRVIELILKHNRNSFIDRIKDDGTIPHPEYSSQEGLLELSEYYTYHPYHQNDSNDPDQCLKYRDFIHYIDDLNDMDIDDLNHKIISGNYGLPDQRIGILKRYIDTHSRIAYIMIRESLQDDSQCKMGVLWLIAQCIGYHKLKLEDIKQSIDILLDDGIVSRLQNTPPLHENIKSRVYNYAEKFFSHANPLFICMSEFTRTIGTVLEDIGIHNILVEADIRVHKRR